ncbi:type II secretion system minor pseudopilin GspH [Pseudomonas sp. SDO528_S397]
MRNGCRGFTLLELMIVVVLVGVMLAMVSFAVGPNPAGIARQEADVIARTLQQLRDRAVLEGREYGVRLSTDGYRTVRLDGRDWRPVTPLRAWPASLQLRLEQEGQFVSLGQDSGPAQLLALSSDETSEFTLTFFIRDRTLLHLSSDGIGQVVIDG